MNESEHSVKAMTEYVVLQLGTVEGGGRWTNVDDVAARSAEAAIRAYAEKNVAPDLTLVAVPARYWKPLRVDRVQKVTLEVTEA